MASRLAPLRTLAFREFRLMWLSSLALMSARWMDMVILGWLVNHLTGSPLAVAWVGFFRFMPFALGPLGGVISDRLDRRKIMLFSVLSSLVAAVMVTLVALLGTIHLWAIYAISLGFGIGFAMDHPARRSLIYDIVGEKLVVNAMSLDQISFTLSRMVGPLMAGFLISVLGEDIHSAGLSFIVVCVVYGLAILPLAMMVDSKIVASVVANSIFSDLWEGIKYSLASPIIRGVLSITVVINILIFPFIQLLPVFADEVLRVGAFELGLMGAALGLGQFIGTIYFVTRPGVSRPGLLFVIGAMSFAIGVLCFALSQWFSVSMVILGILGIGQSAYFILQTSVVLLSSSNEMRGRGIGILTLAIGTGPFGTLLIGLTSENYGAALSVAAAAVFALLLLVVINVVMPDVLRMRSRM